MASTDRKFTQQEIEVIEDVKKYCGPVAVASLETVLLLGDKAKRFQGISELTCSHICQLAQAHGLKLPTYSIRQ